MSLTYLENTTIIVSIRSTLRSQIQKKLFIIRLIYILDTQICTICHFILLCCMGFEQQHHGVMDIGCHVIQGAYAITINQCRCLRSDLENRRKRNWLQVPRSSLAISTDAWTTHCYDDISYIASHNFAFAFTDNELKCNFIFSTNERRAEGAECDTGSELAERPHYL